MGALAITGSLHRIDKDLLGWWLCERQVKSGGLNGRPEKLPDVSVVLCFILFIFFPFWKITLYVFLLPFLNYFCTFLIHFGSAVEVLMAIQRKMLM